MSHSAHIPRHVSTIENIGFTLDEAKTLSDIERTLTQGDIARAIVMPSEGVIHLFNTAYYYCEDNVNSSEAMRHALHAKFYRPPLVVPEELVTPAKGAKPQYLVETTLHPARHTTHRLIK